MNDYLEMKKKHSDEFGEFPMVFAFSNKQFKEGMEKLGLKITDTDKVYKTAGGGFYKRTDAKRLGDMLRGQTKEMDEAIKADIKGDGFVLNMFSYELANHEFCYTGDTEDTLDALGITGKDIADNQNLANGLAEAMQLQWDCEN